MGDSGSLFIGFIFGFISILFDWNPEGESYLYSSIAPIFLFFTIPLLDFLTVFVYRIKNNISPATGGTDHISHRLLNQGYRYRSLQWLGKTKLLSKCLHLESIPDMHHQGQ